VLGPDVPGFPAISVAAFLPMPAGVLAYGPGPPVDLIPYFLGLAAWAGFAVIAIVLSPLTALLRRLRGKRNHKSLEKKPTKTNG
jgi:hypothetical protein